MRRERIFLRAGAFLLIPTALTWLAKTLGFYGPVSAMRLPLDALALGPFAYEAKIIWLAGALMLCVALLAPQRTSQIVLALGTGGILWTGFLYTRLQWARLFSPIKFSQQSTPPAFAWVEGGALLLLCVGYVLADSLLATREAQTERGLPEHEVGEAHAAALQTGAWVAAAACVGALLLGLFYFGVRGIAGLVPVHLNPVAVFFVLGAALGVVLWFTLRKRSPVEA